MSLFLGKIHYWLYNKITWAEEMEEDIISWASAKELPASDWAKEASNRYGEGTGKKPLEDIIDTGNIHGWLQGRIESAELRQAYLITEVLKSNPEFKADLVGLFEKQGQAAAREYDKEVNTPEEAFNALNDFIVEGMPCDRVNELIVSDDTKYSWRTTQCLHRPYWDRVEADIDVFYTLRDAWVKAFTQAIAPGFNYVKPEAFIHEIIR